MPPPELAQLCFKHRRVLPATIVAVLTIGVSSSSFASAVDDQESVDVLAKGADLFSREWLPNDPRAPEGDGLGPFYNETSCIACHYQGGPGGAGPSSTNVEILSPGAKRPTAAGIGPADGTSRSIVLHRFGVDGMYRAWRLRLLGMEHLADMAESPETEIEQVRRLVTTQSSAGRMTVSQRNPPPLFGAGLLDAVGEDVLLAGEKQRFPEFPEIHGRANRLIDGHLGRFGWKAETANLREFVLSACANELGLEVPDHHQATSPMDRTSRAKGLDLTKDQCDALVAYVRHLPASTPGRSLGSREPQGVAEGRSLFEAAGCATCHRPRLGDIQGVYSDLLLHDLGDILSDAGRYHGDRSPGFSTGGAKRSEWRTPPLWGFRDSAPYLHDGRAATLEQAVAFHGGQASGSAKRFFKFSIEEQLKVQAFLRSLAPRAWAASRATPGP
jgi:CxxC motif-containing protein (DUF1111 family)